MRQLSVPSSLQGHPPPHYAPPVLTWKGGECGKRPQGGREGHRAAESLEEDPLAWKLGLGGCRAPKEREGKRKAA